MEVLTIPELTNHEDKIQVDQSLPNGTSISLQLQYDEAGCLTIEFPQSAQDQIDDRYLTILGLGAMKKIEGLDPANVIGIVLKPESQN